MISRRRSTDPLIGLLFLLIACAAITAGLQLRQWTWNITAPVRFNGDMQRNVRFGRRAVVEGYFNVYENVYAERTPGNYDIDYPPLRLLTFTLWMRYNQWQSGGLPDDWQPDAEFNQPLMNFNTLTEAASAIAAFLLVRLWTRRTETSPLAPPRPWHGWGRAMAAAALVWFSPGQLADGHGWASYDVWIPPFFLWSLLLATTERWFIAGIILGCGTMFKGQQLLVAPIFILWPLFLGRPVAAAKWIAGFIVATAAIAAPFILSHQIGQTGERVLHGGAIAWIIGIMLAMLLPTIAAPFRRRFLNSDNRSHVWIVRIVIWTIIMTAIFWPMLLLNAARDLTTVIAAAVASVLAILCGERLRRGNLAMAVATAGGLAVFVGLQFFDSSPAWFEIGFHYGADRFYTLAVGPNANLAALLERSFGWRGLNQTAYTLPAHTLLFWPAQAIDVTSRAFLFSLYLVALLLCSVAAAWHARRRDKRFLVVMAAVWIMFYCLLPQMIGRYLLFGSTVGAIVIAESWGLGLLMFFLSSVTAMETLACMFDGACSRLDGDPNVETLMRVRHFLSGSTPGIGWAVLLAGATLLAVIFIPRRTKNIVSQSAEAISPSNKLTT